MTEDIEMVSAKEAENAVRFWREHAERWERVAVGALWFTATWITLSAYLAWELYRK